MVVKGRRVGEEVVMGLDSINFYIIFLYPEYEIGKPYLPYIEALWEEIEYIDG